MENSSSWKAKSLIYDNKKYKYWYLTAHLGVHETPYTTS